MEALIIDFNLDIQEQETLETFLTTFRPFIDSQAFNIITVLTDYFFVYLIVPKNYPISTPIGPVIDIIDYEQDPFTYITIECYTPKEFYGVMIDTGASKKSIAGYG